MRVRVRVRVRVRARARVRVLVRMRMRMRVHVCACVCVRACMCVLCVRACARVLSVLEQLNANIVPHTRPYHARMTTCHSSPLMFLANLISRFCCIMSIVNPFPHPGSSIIYMNQPRYLPNEHTFATTRSY